MRRFFFLFLIVNISTVSAQKLYTKTGATYFRGSVDAFEPVEATNHSTSVVFNIETNEIAALIFIQAFEFKVALMQEHFNENYMESHDYPKATFKGVVTGFDYRKKGTQEATINGTLTIRGQSKAVSIQGVFESTGRKVILNSKFFVKPEDFSINIPNIVRSKISDLIEVSLNYELTEKS